MNWFLAMISDDGRELWQKGHGYPRAKVREYSTNEFYWDVYASGNDKIANGKAATLELAMSVAGKVLGEYNGQ